MPEKFSDRQDAVVGFQQVRGERVSEGIKEGRLRESSVSDDSLDASLQGRFVQAVALATSGLGIVVIEAGSPERPTTSPTPAGPGGISARSSSVTPHFPTRSRGPVGAFGGSERGSLEEAARLRPSTPYRLPEPINALHSTALRLGVTRIVTRWPPPCPHRTFSSRQVATHQGGPNSEPVLEAMAVHHTAKWLGERFGGRESPVSNPAAPITPSSNLTGRWKMCERS